MDMRRNHNYSIGTDILDDGRVKAKARGSHHNTKTYPKGTTPETAALTLATKIEGNLTTEVRNHNTAGNKADWHIYTAH